MIVLNVIGMLYCCESRFLECDSNGEEQELPTQTDPLGLTSFKIICSPLASDPMGEILPQRLVVLLVYFYQSGEWLLPKV